MDHSLLEQCLSPPWFEPNKNLRISSEQSCLWEFNGGWEDGLTMSRDGLLWNMFPSSCLLEGMCVWCGWRMGGCAFLALFHVKMNGWASWNMMTFLWSMSRDSELDDRCCSLWGQWECGISKRESSWYSMGQMFSLSEEDFFYLFEMWLYTLSSPSRKDDGR